MRCCTYFIFLSSLSFWTKDLYSYNKEQADDDKYNTLTVVMYNLRVGLDAAVDWLEAEHTRLLKEYLKEVRDLPSFGSVELDARVRRWLDDLSLMVRGISEWHFVAPRYFRDERSKVRKQGYVALLPKNKK